MIPKAALRYIQNKKLSPAFSYKDIWNEEHATNFTVAKAVQMDVLKDIKDAVETALSDGQTFEQFKKNLEPTLRQKGWWGHKDVFDEKTGRTIYSQVGSDRRLKTIYVINLRSAYQEGRWERTQESTAHPYLMYRVGNSKNHRKEHLAWDGLVLPKDDPWWNSHYPPNGWGCKCWTMAVSEARKQRLEETGVKVPPSVDGEPGYTVKIKTQAPPEAYWNFYNERKGIIEKVPKGVDPAFNWNPGRAGRDLPVFDSFMQKGKDGFHEEIEPIATAILTNKIRRDKFESFIEGVYDGKIKDYEAAPVGFIDNKIALWLKKNTSIETGDSVTIALEARLLTGPKGIRHSLAGDAIGKSGALTIIDALLYGNVYHDVDKGTLIYLFPHSIGRLSKITVNPRQIRKPDTSSILGPVVVNIESIGATNKDTEFYRITKTLPKIK